MRGFSRTCNLHRLAMGALALTAPGFLVSTACAQPQPGEQQKVLASASDFARDYIRRLPDFTCRRVTQHYRTKTGPTDWQPQVNVTEELSYYGHEEHYQIVEINGVPKKKVPFAVLGEGFISTNGNFGWMLAQLFDPISKAAFQWKASETLRGRPVYVFSYRVLLANSRAQSGRCTSWVLFQNCKAFTYGYHGLVYVEKDTSRIMRITQEPEDVPPAYTAGSESVDYDMVTVAGAEYLLPVADTFETHASASRTGPGKVLFRNESVYRDYRKFTAESSLSTTMEAVPATSATPPPRAPRSSEASKTMEAANYFALRDAVVKGKVPLIARGAVAAAFNDVAQAERDLGALVRAAPDSDSAMMAIGLLAAVNARNGRIRKALAELDLLGAQAQSAEWKDSRERLAVLARHPEQSVAASGFSRLHYTKKHDALEVRFTVNGKESEFVLDTGAALSVIAESRARALGLTIHDDTFAMADIAGKKLACRAATAPDLTAGNVRLRNVPFCVLPDSQPGFVADPESAPAILGLPVLMAFGTIRWDAAGNFEIGFPSKRPRLQDSNICFDSSSLLVEATVARRRLSFVLDTGNPTTLLFSSFSEDSPNAVPQGAKRVRREFQGLGEAAEVEASEMRDVPFRVAGKDLVLRSVPLLLEPIDSECTNCSGNAGMDLFSTARRVTLDFNAMRLLVETK